MDKIELHAERDILRERLGAAQALIAEAVAYLEHRFDTTPPCNCDGCTLTRKLKAFTGPQSERGVPADSSSTPSTSHPSTAKAAASTNTSNRLLPKLIADYLMNLHQLLTAIRAEGADAITIHEDGTAVVWKDGAQFLFYSLTDLEKNFAQSSTSSMPSTACACHQNPTRTQP